MLAEPASQTAIIDVTPEAVDRAAIALMPRSEETPIQAVTRQMATYRAINTLIDLTFVKGVDFDTIPGTDKPTLQLPGIEKARGLLGLREEFHDIAVVREYNPAAPFFYYEVECVLYSIVGGQEIARGQGVCHTREKAFLRTGVRVCPECEKPTIKKSKFAPRGSAPGTKPGWYCDEKAGGCNAQFGAEDPRVTSQETGNAVDTQLVWDGVNRARKIANKRALADAIKRVGMLSSRFTVDLEDDLKFSVDEVNGNHPANIIQMTPPPATEAPKPPQLVENPGQHWSDVEKNRADLVNRAIELLYLEIGDTWNDLLKLAGLDAESVKKIATGADMGKLVKTKADEASARLSAENKARENKALEEQAAKAEPTADETANLLKQDSRRIPDDKPIVNGAAKPPMNGPRKSPFTSDSDAAQMTAEEIALAERELSKMD